MFLRLKNEKPMGLAEALVQDGIREFPKMIFKGSDWWKIKFFLFVSHWVKFTQETDFININ